MTPTTNSPRLLLIDHTQIGDGTATGEIKANLFGTWPQSRIAQIFRVSSRRVGFSHGDQLSQFSVRGNRHSPSSLARKIAAFNPEVILYRPVPDTDAFHAVAMNFIERSDRPLVSWIMDDWPTFARRDNKAGHDDLEEDWRWILARSSLRLSISEAMSVEFASRYGYHFVPVANAVDPVEWPLLAKPAVPFKVRYTGSLQPEMALDGLVRIARAVERLGRDGHDIEFEISTRKYWYDRYSQYFSQFTRTSVLAGNLTSAEYRKWLGRAHVNVIVYNFDDLSRAYIRFSLANKLPECMISGAALLAHGPPDVATMRYLDEVDCGIRIKEPSEDRLVDALEVLITDRECGNGSAARAREIAIANHGLSEARQKLVDLIGSAARTPVPEVAQSPRSLRRLTDVITEPGWLDIVRSLRNRSTRRLIRYVSVGLSASALVVGAAGALQIALILSLIAVGVFSLPRIAREVITAQRMRNGIKLASYQLSTFQTVPIDRDDKAQCDEVRIVYEVLKRYSGIGQPGLMIDVGAHWGSSLKRFAADGWKVFAFEPDPANREKLIAATTGQPHVVLSAEAVSDTTGSVVPFFASEESTGISSLSAFRDTHRQVAQVTTVTLNDVVQRHGIAHVDFLKIDVEGFEKAVLDGLDFDKIRPSCVVAEYEDAKTESLGYSVHDLARFLVDRGYSVFVSEWHPIERYGIKHSWRRIFEYPSEVLAGSWGNLVAFIDKPPVPILYEAVIAATDTQVGFAAGEAERSAATSFKIVSEPPAAS